MNLVTNYLVGRLYARLSHYCEEKDLGLVVAPGTSYRCFWEDRQRVRQPTLSYINKERLWLAGLLGDGEVELVPDLVMEFVSEGEPPVEVDAKVGEWQSAGVRQVWVVPPRKGDVELLGEDVIPGFRCRVGDLIQGGREWSGDRPRKEKKGPLSISIA